MSHLKPDDLAHELDVPRSWVMRHLHELPHQRVGKHIRFTPEQMAEILARFEQRPANEGNELPGVTARSRAHHQNRRAAS